MSSIGLNSYGCNLKKIAQANARDDQMQVLRTNRFKASLVEDPLRSSHDLISVIENARQIPRK